MLLANLILAVVVHAQPLVNADVLEPSIRNEVDHALEMAKNAGLAAVTNAVSSTNAVCFVKTFRGMNATERAIALVSAQKDGRWFYRGEDVTSVAVRLLCEAAGITPPPR